MIKWGTCGKFGSSLRKILLSLQMSNQSLRRGGGAPTPQKPQIPHMSPKIVGDRGKYRITKFTFGNNKSGQKFYTISPQLQITIFSTIEVDVTGHALQGTA